MPFAGRVSVDGPAVTVQGNMEQTFALLLHELATNAAKHGALSRDNGTVSIKWTVEMGAITFRWEESGGPPVTEPTRRGFGTSLLEGAVSSDVTVKPRLIFRAEGLVYEFRAPFEALGVEMSG
jgi:two-component sensor histidine kinase